MEELFHYMHDTVLHRFPKLETPRLILREMRQEDASDLLHFLSDIDVIRYYDVQPMRKLVEVQAMIERHRLRYQRNEGVRWAMTLKETSQVIGSCGFFWEWSARRGETSYVLAKEYWGRGLMTEALQAMVNCAFKDWPQLNRLEAFVAEPNTGSRKVLHKLGFQQEGLFKERLFIEGHFYDERLYSLLRKDFVAQRDRVRANQRSQFRL
jgi:ribosomal-protein-alanine N-acetyltransferase